MDMKLQYVCLPTTKVYLEKLQNSSEAISPSDINASVSLDGVTNCLKFRYALNYLGKDYEKITVPCTPAIQYSVLPHKAENAVNEVPRFIKVPYETKYSGYASGKRSAIIIENGKAYRYKGCGNLNEGFVIENNELRGSHYSHTAKRELHMTEYISKILQERLGISSANRSLLMYQIGEEITEYKIESKLPLLPKYCCVFETVGDRRAGTHLISPLQVLFMSLGDWKQIPWKQIFVKKGRHNPEDGLIGFMVDFELEVNKGEKFLEKYDARPEELEKWVNLIVEEGIDIGVGSDYSELVEIVLETFLKDSSAKEVVREKLNRVKNLPKMISIICAKIGYEMGRIKRVFCEEGINWGFFNDHGNSWHCNAHLNNLVVCQPAPQSPLILPLDYDLAFKRQQFVNITIGAQTYGKNDPDLFEELMLGQYNAMEYSLSGMEIMSNFSYGIKSKSEEKANEQEQLARNMTRTSFRDTLIANFRAGMRNKKEAQEVIQKLWDTNIQSVKDVVDVCLIISGNFQT